MSAAFGPQDVWGTSAGHPGDIDNMIRSSRFNNTIKYTSPILSGLVLNATATLGGVAGDFSQNSAYTFGALYTHTNETQRDIVESEVATESAMERGRGA